MHGIFWRRGTIGFLHSDLGFYAGFPYPIQCSFKYLRKPCVFLSYGTHSSSYDSFIFFDTFHEQNRHVRL